MLKSLLLATACAYINPPGLEPKIPVIEATPGAILREAFAMGKGEKKIIWLKDRDDLCAKVEIETSTDEALDGFIDWNGERWHVVVAPGADVPLPRPRPNEDEKLGGIGSDYVAGRKGQTPVVITEDK